MPVKSTRNNTHYNVYLHGTLPGNAGAKKQHSKFISMLTNVKNIFDFSRDNGGKKAGVTKSDSLSKQCTTSNKITPERKVPGSKVDRQIHLLQQAMVEVKNELESMPTNVNPSVLSDKVACATNKALKASLTEDAALGKLYLSVLNEEVEMLSVNKNTLHHPHSYNSLTPDETLIVTKNVLQKKLAIMDFCLKILGLHEQAGWMSSSKSNLHTSPFHSVDEMLDVNIKFSEEKPVLTSRRGRDPTSELYHEKQYDLSGTCLLHANNHYLASWCEREGMPFLPLTPRRLKMILSGLQQRLVAESKELAIMDRQANIIPDDLTNPLSPRLYDNERFIIDHRSDLIEYDIQVHNNKIVDVITTGLILNEKVTEKVNQLYGMPAQIFEGSKTFAEWNQDLTEIKKLEQQQDSLICIIKSEFEDIAHAICFNKKNNEWYLQDSNFPKPIKCQPGQFIRFINNKETNPLIRERLDSCDYKQENRLTKNSTLGFYHYEPQVSQGNVRTQGVH